MKSVLFPFYFFFHFHFYSFIFTKFFFPLFSGFHLNGSIKLINQKHLQLIDFI